MIEKTIHPIHRLKEMMRRDFLLKEENNYSRSGNELVYWRPFAQRLNLLVEIGTKAINAEPVEKEVVVQSLCFYDLFVSETTTRAVGAGMYVETVRLNQLEDFIKQHRPRTKLWPRDSHKHEYEDPPEDYCGPR